MLADHIPYYILDLLQLTPAVHVEGLGRFEAIFHSARMDASKTKISPPHIEAAFKADQGEANDMLEAFIRYTSGVQGESPKKAINDFVRSVFKHTEDGSAFTIDRFGTFVKSDQGHLRFTPDWDAFNISFSGLESVELKPVQSTHEEVVSLTPPEPYIPKAVASEDVTEEQDERDEIAAAASIATVAQTKEAFEKDLDKIDPSNSKLWWIVLSTAIILIAILCVYLIWDITTSQKKLNELRQAQVNTTIIDSIISDQAIQADTALKDASNQDVEDTITSTVPPIEQTPEDGPPCYIVVGAFGDPANVDKMVSRLKTMNYTVEELKGQSLTKVAIRTSCDQDKLQRLLNEVRSSVNPESWIY